MWGKEWLDNLPTVTNLNVVEICIQIQVVWLWHCSYQPFCSRRDCWMKSSRYSQSLSKQWVIPQTVGSTVKVYTKLHVESRGYLLSWSLVGPIFFPLTTYLISCLSSVSHTLIYPMLKLPSSFPRTLLVQSKFSSHTLLPFHFRACILSLLSCFLLLWRISNPVLNP